MNCGAFTIHDMVRRNAQLHRDQTAFVCGGRRVTHIQVLEKAAHLAAGLRALGIEAGDRIALLCDNRLEAVLVLAAAARMGFIVVPVNTRLSKIEVDFVLHDAAPRVLIAEREPSRRLDHIDRMHRISLDAGTGDGWQDFDSLFRESEATPAQIGDDAPIAIIYTAAVAGNPKGALLTHRNLLASAQQLGRAWNLGPGDAALGVLPLFHVAGISLCLALQAAGGSTVLVRKFEPHLVARLIHDCFANVIGTFSPMMEQILDAASQVGSTLDCLRIAFGLEPPATIERLKRAAPHADFWAGYGQTETAGIVTLSRAGACPGAMGQALSMTTIAVIDDAGVELPCGQQGRIAVRGPCVFSGYWNTRPAGSTSPDADWHDTGDLGRIDQAGYLWMTGRSPAKELIKSGGENVYPAEVEGVLRAYPDVAEAVVFGLADPDWGEAVIAVCVLRPGCSVSEDVLKDFVAGRIARYKSPKRIVFAQALPLDAAGAPDRAAAKAQFGAAAARSDPPPKP